LTKQITHVWPDFTPQPPDGVPGLAPLATIEFHVRDAGVHRYSTPDQIEYGALPAAQQSVSLSGAKGKGASKAAAAAASASAAKSKSGGVVDLTEAPPPAAKKAKTGAAAAAPPPGKPVEIELSDEEEGGAE
jgi:hypothetical protein